MKEHVIINKDRTVNVPNSLQRLGVQYDHNVNAIVFDCPRYPDEDPTVDMSKMQIFINYMLPNKKLGASQGVNVEIDPEDNTLMHFSWKITRAITQYKGVLSTLICVKQVNDDGNEVYHWNTVMFQRFTVDEGMECTPAIETESADVIAKILMEIDSLKKNSLKKNSDSGIKTKSDITRGNVNYLSTNIETITTIQMQEV